MVVNILLIEDETKVATFIKDSLEENSFIVDVANDGNDGKLKAFSNKLEKAFLPSHYSKPEEH